MDDIIADLPYSLHPEDSYLRLVVHRAQHNNDWVTHVQNLQTGGFVSGHYFRTKEEALKDLITRAQQNYV